MDKKLLGNQLHLTVIRDVTISVTDVDEERKIMDFLLGQKGKNIDNRIIYELEESNLIIEENKYGIPRQSNTLGLNHIAILFEDKKSMVDAIKRGLREGITPFVVLDKPDELSAYYYDTDSNVVELYFQKTMVKEDKNYLEKTRVLSLREFLEQNHTNLSVGISKPRIGHLGLDVRSLDEAKWFFHDMLEMEIIEKNIPGSMYFGYNGITYIATFIWRTEWGKKARFPYNPRLGLLSYSIKLLKEPIHLWMEGPLEDPTGAVLYLL